MTDKYYYGIVKTKLLPVFKKFIFGKKIHTGYCSVLYCYYYDVEPILNFIRKYTNFSISDQYNEAYWFKPYVYYPRYKLLKKAIKNYEEVRYLNEEYQIYLFVKNVIYSEFKKIIGRKYPSVYSYLGVGLGLDENVKSISEFIENYSNNTEFDLINFYNYSYRKKIIKNAIKNYERENYIY
jgi:hypothetical protein